ncbi:MAG: M15 family metallopeptidase, partial [Saprospiraceae bacterium]
MKTMIGKSFKITKSDARVRDDQFQMIRNTAGSFQVVPKDALVTIENYNLNGLQRLDYLKVTNFGWTARTNFEFSLLNEVVRTIAPGYFSQAEDHFTVVDEDARIRKKTGNDYLMTKELIPVCTLLIAKEFSADRKLVQVAYTRRVDAGFEEDTTRKPVWTKTSNLFAGWFDAYGLNSLWRKGNFLGLKSVSAVVGGNGDIKHVVTETFDFYLKMMEAARKDGLGLELTSGFRTWGKQHTLFELHLKNKGNLAAKPGHSNHQNGIAFDLNT